MVKSQLNLNTIPLNESNYIFYPSQHQFIFFFAIAVKTGNPTDDELVDLSKQIGDNWKSLAGRLGFTRAEITAFHKENEKYAEKAEAMLLKWQENKGDDATYQALYDALCHKFVGSKALAEKFCCFKK